MATEWCMWTGLPAHDRHSIVNAATKEKGEEEGGEDESEIHNAVRRSLTVTRTSNHYKLFLKINMNAPNKIFWIVYVFQLFVCLFPIISLNNWEFTVNHKQKKSIRG
jgi:hypothetical protein